jgi:MoaD family protein
VNITVQFFSFLRDFVGAKEISLEIPPKTTVAELLQQLKNQHPKLREAEKTILVAVGVEFAKPDQVLEDGDVVSLMPPLQGGVDDELLITEQPIDEAEAKLGKFSGDVGGIVTFWGVVRDVEEGKRIAALEYSAYREMTEHQFRKILSETRQKFPVKRVRIVHRLGKIAVGEPSLLVRVEAAHRGEAFAAAQFIIDELKQKVPIWKKGVQPQSS